MFFPDFTALGKLLHFKWFNLFIRYCYARKARAFRDEAKRDKVINRREIVKLIPFVSYAGSSHTIIVFHDSSRHL